MRLSTGLYLVVVIVAVGLAGCGTEGAQSPLKSGRVPQVTQLTDNHDVFEANPIYSPDGAWILFESDVTGNRDLWLMPAAGGEPTQLTTHAGFDSAPFWSPDGTRVVFESDRSGSKNIWILDVGSPGAGPVPMTSGPWDDGDPVWSPDGSLIAYESTRENDWGTDLWASPVDGGPAVRLTTTGDGIYHRTAEWSPDGARLVFESNRVGGYSALCTMPASGGEVTRITPEAAYEGHPAWSPDGKQIAYEARANGAMEIFAIPAGGGSPVQVTESGGFWPRWSPTGTSIIYCVFGDPEPNIWMVEVDW